MEVRQISQACRDLSFHENKIDLVKRSSKVKATEALAVASVKRYMLDVPEVSRVLKRYEALQLKEYNFVGMLESQILLGKPIALSTSPHNIQNYSTSTKSLGPLLLNEILFIPR